MNNLDNFQLVNQGLNNSSKLELVLFQQGGLSANTYYKWKSSVNSQVVIKSGDIFYKIYETMKEDFFKRLIRKVLSEIYQDLGIHWIVKEFEKDNFVYEIEEREELPICTGEFGDNLLSYRNILNELEKRLNISIITKQLKGIFPTLYKVKLLRDCVNKNIDYAYYGNQVILLDDSDFYLALIDNNRKIIRFNFNEVGDALYIPIYYSVNGEFSEYYLIDADYDGNLLDKRMELVDKLTISQSINKDNSKISNLFDIFNKMQEDNIRLLEN